MDYDILRIELDSAEMRIEALLQENENLREELLVVRTKAAAMTAAALIKAADELALALDAATDADRELSTHDEITDSQRLARREE